MIEYKYVILLDLSSKVKAASELERAALAEASDRHLSAIVDVFERAKLDGAFDLDHLGIRLDSIRIDQYLPDAKVDINTNKVCDVHIQGTILARATRPRFFSGAVRNGWKRQGTSSSRV